MIHLWVSVFLSVYVNLNELLFSCIFLTYHFLDAWSFIDCISSLFGRQLKIGRKTHCSSNSLASVVDGGAFFSRRFLEKVLDSFSDFWKTLFYLGNHVLFCRGRPIFGKVFLKIYMAQWLEQQESEVIGGVFKRLYRLYFLHFICFSG